MYDNLGPFQTGLVAEQVPLYCPHVHDFFAFNTNGSACQQIWMVRIIEGVTKEEQQYKELFLKRYLVTMWLFH